MSHVATKLFMNSKLFVVLVCVIGIMGMWLLKLGSELAVAQKRASVPVVIVPSAVLSSEKK